MVREFEYKGEVFRATVHGIVGHEEIFVVHIEEDGTEGWEESIDRMTDENDTSAPVEAIVVQLCEMIIPEADIDVKDPNGAFAWRDGEIAFDVHNGVQAHA